MNKNNRKKFNIYLSIFAVVAIITTMFFSGFVVNAAETITTVAVSDYTFSDNYSISSDYITDIGSDDSLFFITNYSDFVSNNGFYVSSGSIYDPSIFNNYVIMGQTSGTFSPDTTRYKLFQAPDDSFICRYQSDNHYSFQLAIPSGYISSNSFNFVYYQFNNNSDLSSVSGTVSSRSGIVSTVPFVGGLLTRNIDGIDYNCINISFDSYGTPGQQYMTAVSSSLPLYDGEFSSITSLSDLENKNNTMSGSGSANREDMDNQAFLKQGSKMYLTNNTFNDGSLYVFPVFTDDQMKNPTNYTLRLIGSSSYGLRVRVNSPDLRAIKPITYNSSDVGMIYGIYDGLPLEDFNSSVIGQLSYDIPFSWFSGGQYTMSLSDLNKYCRVSGVDDGLLPLASGLSSAYGKDDNWQQFNSSGTMSFNVKNFNFSTDDFSLYFNDLIPTDAHYIINAYVVNNNTDYVSSVPMITLDFNLVTGEVVPIVDNTVSDGDILTSMAVDKLPSGYNNHNSPPTYYPDTITNQNPPSSSGGSSNSSSNSNNNIESGAIVINNNPTFNNENNNNLSSKENSGLIPFILGMITGNQKAGTTTIENATNTSGWLNIMNTTFSFVPVGVWNLLIGAFTAAIGIMIVSFILGIIIKFIT